jgi:glycosyltransferase involved in cell wall biosynthesis
MYKGQNINVIVPAYNEEELIQTMLAGVPEFIDGIIVIDDCSDDTTNNRVLASAVEDERIQLITHEENMGLGQSLIDGYLASLTVVMTT